jgi:hypothetical protein
MARDTSLSTPLIPDKQNPNDQSDELIGRNLAIIVGFQVPLFPFHCYSLMS